MLIATPIINMVKSLSIVLHYADSPIETEFIFYVVTITVVHTKMCYLMVVVL